MIQQDLQIEILPTLYPNQKQFQDFENYVNEIQKIYKDNYGAVVPPKDWKAKQNGYETQDVTNFILKTPIEQHIQGKNGFYELSLHPKKSISIKEYQKKVPELDSKDRTTEEIEQLTISFSQPLYGADVLGSIMDTKISWNLNELPTPLREGLNNVKVSGVNQAYIYAGCWKSMFGWHTEDLDFNSINYLHQGKPKFWYTIPERQFDLFIQTIKPYFEQGFKQCPEFLRHKNIMVNPYVLLRKCPELCISKITQQEGEFVVTFNKGLHAGFNSGFNIAEAVNFASMDSLGTLIEANVFFLIQSCRCRGDSVSINKFFFFNNLIKSKYNQNQIVKAHYESLKEKYPYYFQQEQEQTVAKINKKIQKKERIFWIQCDACDSWQQMDKQKFYQNKNLKKYYCVKHQNSGSPTKSGILIN